MAYERGNVVPLPLPSGDREEISPFTPFYASRMAGRAPPPPPSWILDGLIERETVAIVAGPTKAGKSLAAQQLATCLAMGVPWLGYETVKSRTFFMATEDKQEWIERRQTAITDYLGVDPLDLELDLSWDARDRRESTLVNYEKFSDKPVFTRLWYQLWQHAEDDGIENVILDPTTVIFGGNENFKKQVVNFIRECTKMAARRNGIVILLHHPSKADPTGYGGSGAWLSSARAGLTMHFHPDYNEATTGGLYRNRRVLRPLGGNYTPGRNAVDLIYRDGVWQEHDAAGDIEKSRGPSLTGADLRYRLMQGLILSISRGVHVYADDVHAQSMANRARKAHDPMLSRVPLNRLYDAQAEMIRNGEVILVDVGGKCLLRPAQGPAYRGEKEWSSS